MGLIQNERAHLCRRESPELKTLRTLKPLDEPANPTHIDLRRAGRECSLDQQIAAVALDQRLGRRHRSGSNPNRRDPELAQIPNDRLKRQPRSEQTDTPRPPSSEKPLGLQLGQTFDAESLRIEPTTELRDQSQLLRDRSLGVSPPRQELREPGRILSQRPAHPHLRNQHSLTHDQLLSRLTEKEEAHSAAPSTPHAAEHAPNPNSDQLAPSERRARPTTIDITPKSR